MWYIIAAVVIIILIVLTTVDSKKTDKFLVTSFNTDEMKLLVYESQDGVKLYKRNVSYYPRRGNKTVRDPSYCKVGDEYYIVYTVTEWGTGHEIGMCKTKDFYSYEELPCISVGDFNKVWAPTFYKENDKVYIIANAAYEDEQFSSYMKQIVQRANKEKKPLLFINAWNEWGEGAFLEPDEKYGYKKLEAIQKALEASWKDNVL